MADTDLSLKAAAIEASRLTEKDQLCRSLYDTRTPNSGSARSCLDVERRTHELLNLDRFGGTRKSAVISSTYPHLRRRWCSRLEAKGAFGCEHLRRICRADSGGQHKHPA